jgi:hypothetical protein
MLDALAAPRAREDVGEFTRALRRDDEGDGAADDILGRVAVEALGGRVPARHRAVERLADDGVGGGLDDGGQPLARDLGLAAVGDVVEDEDDADGLPAPVFDGGGAVVNRRLAAVARDEHGVVGEPDRHALAQDFLHRALDLLARLLAEDAEDLAERAAPRLGGRPSGEPLGDRVEERDAARAVGRDDGVADAGERRRERLLAAARGQLGVPAPLREVDEHRGDEQEEGRLQHAVVGQREGVEGREEDVVADEGPERDGEQRRPAAPAHGRDEHGREEEDEDDADLFPAEGAAEGEGEERRCDDRADRPRVARPPGRLGGAPTRLRFVWGQGMGVRHLTPLIRSAGARRGLVRSAACEKM